MKKFKEINQHQLSVLPPSLDELVEPNHLVRIVDKFVSLLPSRLWDEIFTGGGAPSYHPALMLKVILYAYSQKIYSCRDIAKAIRQDITFMWLTGMQRPTFNTVNRFRTEYFKDILEDIFTELLDFLHGKGYISYQDFFVDEFQACRACALKPQCTKSKNNRQIHYNVKLEKFKAQARTNLDSQYGLALRKRRGPEVETFFGDLRHNCRFNRFLLRGLVNTEHEFGLLAIAHILRKIAKDALNNVSDSVYITDIFAFLKEFMCFLTHLLKRQKNFHFSLNISDNSLVYGNF